MDLFRIIFAILLPARPGFLQSRLCWRRSGCNILLTWPLIFPYCFTRRWVIARR